MDIRNFEFKAKVENLELLEQKLLTLHPVFVGEDQQTDTYFNVRKGRLKLRDGSIEQALIYYNRPDIQGAKLSDVLVYQTNPANELREILTKVLGVKVVVRKTRRIFFVGNVKIHFDTLINLGCFLEVEAIDMSGDPDIEELKKQCMYFADFFNIDPSQFVSESYSDMLLAGFGRKQKTAHPD